MYNPSYLIKSRHDIYYFRYPLELPHSEQPLRVSISLRTRCPKEALLLAKMLEYYSIRLLEALDLTNMEHAHIKEVVRSFYADKLETVKTRIDKEGQLPKQNIANINEELARLDQMIEAETNDYSELYSLEQDNDEASPIEQDIKPIMQKYELDFPAGSREHKMLSEAYKFARRNYFLELLEYNSQVTEYSISPVQQTTRQTKRTNPLSEYRLGKLIEQYMEEEKLKKNEQSTFDDKQTCLAYLTDLLGADLHITNLDIEKARYVRTQLLKTPKSRNTKQETRSLTLTEQIEITTQQGLKTLSPSSIKKYLDYFRGFMAWAKDLDYVATNPFKSITVPTNKKTSRYMNFNEGQIKLMLSELDKGKDGLANTESKYWGMLIAIYTGARRNEIASLLPEDIKRDQKTGYWYFEINDEEETKKVKTEAAKRIVPVHSALIERGFLDFVEQAKTRKPRAKHKGNKPRLLYDMTYHPKERWGRKLGRFANENFLPKLGLKGDKFVLHSLRHSFITSLSANGVKAELIKSMVGHEQGTVTFDIYTHFGVGHLKQFKKAIEELPYYD